MQSVIQERDQLAGRIQALQEAVKTRDQDWTAKVRGLEQKLRAAEEATRAAAAAAKPAETATPIAPKPAAAKASTGKTAAPAKRPALPLISRKVVERERPRPVRADPPPVAEAPIEREMPSVGDAVAAAGESVRRSGVGRFLDRGRRPAGMVHGAISWRSSGARWSAAPRRLRHRPAAATIVRGRSSFRPVQRRRPRHQGPD